MGEGIWIDQKRRRRNIHHTVVMKKHYKFPVMCLLMIKESIDTWEKHLGSDGYFDFIEGYKGRKITGNEMNFSIMSSGVLAM